MDEDIDRRNGRSRDQLRAGEAVTPFLGVARALVEPGHSRLNPAIQIGVAGFGRDARRRAEAVWARRRSRRNLALRDHRLGPRRATSPIRPPCGCTRRERK